MMSDERLRQLASTILDEQTPAFALRAELGLLTDLLRDHATVRIEPTEVRGDGETFTSSGLALSPTMAGRCADDIVRTVVFARGVQQAIQEVRVAHPDRPTHLLYAGCGPYAVLALPSMALFGPDELQVTLLDIHEASVDSARTVIDALGLSGRIRAYEAVDACHYEVLADRPPDILLSETMNVCLKKEPQVPIARHLLAQAPLATLIPESVRVDAYLVDVSKEFSFLGNNRSKLGNEAAEPVPPERDRLFLGTVFELNAATITEWTDLSDDRLPAASIHIPHSLEGRYTPMLLTTVTVHRDYVLRAYDSGLTIPKPIPYDGAIRGGDTLEFHYELGSHPGLVCDVTRA